MSARRNVILVVAAVALLGAAVLVYALRTREDLSLPSSYAVYCACLETKQEVAITAKLTDPLPFANPTTGRRTVYPWWFCNDCRYRFVPAPVPDSHGGPPKPPMMATCPHCGSSSTGSWAKGLPDMDNPAGDCPLPPMPK